MDGGSSSVSTLCSRCQNFYGSDATLGMCSACFREHQKANASSGPQAPPVVSQGAETAAAVAAVAAATSSQPEQQQVATGATGAAEAVASPAAPEVAEAKAGKANEAAAMPNASDDNAAVAAAAAVAPPAVPAEAALASPAAAAAAAAAPPSSEEPPARAPQPPGRCMACRKKVSLAARFSCRCGYEFCSAHRLAEDHECSFDWKGMGRDALTRANPLVQASKVDKI